VSAGGVFENPGGVAGNIADHKIKLCECNSDLVVHSNCAIISVAR